MSDPCDSKSGIRQDKCGNSCFSVSSNGKSISLPSRICIEGTWINSSDLLRAVVATSPESGPDTAYAINPSGIPVDCTDPASFPYTIDGTSTVIPNVNHSLMFAHVVQTYGSGFVYDSGTCSYVRDQGTGQTYEIATTPA